MRIPLKIKILVASIIILNLLCIFKAYQDKRQKQKAKANFEMFLKSMEADVDGGSAK